MVVQPSQTPHGVAGATVCPVHARLKKAQQEIVQSEVHEHSTINDQLAKRAESTSSIRRPNVCIAKHGTMLAASLRRLRPTSAVACLKRGLGTRVTRLDQFATIDPSSWNGSNPHTVKNLLAGEWTSTAETESVVDPLNGEVIMAVPKTSVAELAPFCDAMASCSKSGLHNPFKNVSRYVQLGEVSDRIANVGACELFFVLPLGHLFPSSLCRQCGSPRSLTSSPS